MLLSQLLWLFFETIPQEVAYSDLVIAWVKVYEMLLNPDPFL